MEPSDVDDGTDFRPFFDMVIGILFVLLILVAAQTYFQQAQVDTASSDIVKREATLRRSDIAAFLDALAARLRAGGLPATTDGDDGAVLLPLRNVLAVGVAGLPSLEVQPSGRLGSALAELTACVTLPRSGAPFCSAFARLNLDALVVTTGVGSLPSGVALPRDRFADLGSALLSAKLMSGDPRLVAASNAGGERVVTFGTAPAAPEAAGSSGPEVGGSLVLDFNFR